MKEYEIVYTPLIDILSDVLTSPDTTNYAATADSNGKLAQFTDLIEQLDKFIEELETNRASKSIYDSFHLIYATISPLKSTFPDFPVLNYEKLLLQITFRQKVAETLIPLGLTFTED